MFFRENIFKELPEDLMRSISQFLTVPDLLILAATSNQIMCVALALVAETIQSNTRLAWKLDLAVDQVIDMPRGNSAQEQKLLQRAEVFLCLGARQSSIADSSAKNGHTEILKMLFNHGLEFNPVKISRIAAEYNQGTVLELLTQNGFGLDEKHAYQTRTLTDLAMDSNSHDVLRFLGSYGVNFAEEKFENNLTAFQRALKIEFGESARQFQARFDNFLILLQTGSFPKEGKKSFLEWLEERYQTAMYRAPSFGGEFFMFMDLDYLNYVTDQLNKIPDFEKNFKKLTTEVQGALEKYEADYSRNKKIINNMKRTQPNETEQAIELTTFRKKLI